MMGFPWPICIVPRHRHWLYCNGVGIIYLSIYLVPPRAIPLPSSRARLFFSNNGMNNGNQAGGKFQIHVVKKRQSRPRVKYSWKIPNTSAYGSEMWTHNHRSLAVVTPKPLPGIERNPHP